MEHTTREIEIKTTRPIWKSWYAFQQFVDACKEWKRVTYLHPDFKLYSPKIVESIEKEALARWEKIGIAKCINLIPELPLWGDKKYYAWYNAWIQHTRYNFDKYFNNL
jgi:hypothetical protein